MAARRRKKRDDEKKLFMGLSIWGFTIFSLLILLLLVSGFFLGQLWVFVKNDKAEIEVPYLVGLNLEDAEKAAKEAGLKLSVIKYDYSNEIGKDRIIAHTPPTGTLVKEGRSIHATQSLGKKDIPVPQLIHKSISDARAELEQLGLTATEPEGRYDDDAPINAVIDQDPRFGELAAKGQNIKLTYSKGASRRSVEMPNLKDMSLEDALEELDHLGLKVSKVTRVYSPSASKAHISGQAPNAGILVKRESEIILTLSLPIHEKTLGERQFRVVVNVPASDTGIEVRIIKDDRNETIEVYREVIKGPARIEKKIEAYGATKVSIYFDGRLIREENF
jgi:beta-lactam-binding protein with PASTA domain